MASSQHNEGDHRIHPNLRKESRTQPAGARLIDCGSMLNRNESVEVESQAALRDEAALFSRYLAGGPTQPEVVERYVDACRQLLLDHPAGEDTGLLTFVRRHPSSLPALDAACGIVRPEAILRKKLFLMLALLETSPAHAALFIATPRPFLSAAGRLAFHGLSASMKIVAGLVLYPLARGAR